MSVTPVGYALRVRAKRDIEYDLGDSATLTVAKDSVGTVGGSAPISGIINEPHMVVTWDCYNQPFATPSSACEVIL